MVSAVQVYLDEDTSSETLFQEHLPLVKIIANHISVRLPPGKTVDDLIQVGMIGLLDASRTYVPNMGAEFKSYASIRIRGAIIDELRRETWMPRSVQQMSRSLSKAIQSVENRLGRSATDREIADEMGVSIDEYNSIVESVAGCSILSLDDTNCFSEIEDKEETPLQHAQRDSLKSTLADAIGELSEQEQAVVALYYDYGLNLREIGQVLEVSESRACQIHSQATSRLRSKMLEMKMQNELKQ